ncbi:MAG: hypothetical protein OQK75_00055 [Gammaproteobacteria bacterium]|nr:hypothetical protein [Gammaproteobacteria bacterium]MCW8986035.1 hypothetical protein [Gammaproteobacteria bacterium]MCW9030651.1 hypothetical protein [Gammaproteobacteria bacterium]
MSARISTRGVKYLEITMRDVLDGLEDAASYMNYQSVPEVVEILSIEPPGRARHSQNEVISFQNAHPADAQEPANIVDYLIKRELKISA